MVYAKFQDDGTSGSEEEDFKGFGHIWAWQSSWSGGQDNFYEFLPPPPHTHTSHGGSTYNLAAVCPGVSEMFENNGHIHVHVYSPEQGQTTLWVFFSQKHKPSVNLVTRCKFFSLKRTATVFLFKPKGSQI